ncbi:NADH:ubiquinone oxidoreductase subunit NDUFA12 [Nitrospirillum sp. BR 11163]|uniref:NADH:ubiquinone oxidoreductase subunit NDUFA12 n=1 Tax=Nitrospirillum sp. BR 11163 TaxID=3104323 RepID=UPI002AFDCC42|nr:NADH:ubiquinone oxidoreductase subunit NDUFA12 [Nitrospirillum sp. BR 11163]MEA1674436.1 NADH:ubiquinone oxidoreductase subunit NDUFA12 [Nitrospirillum sp. BR 11163]
MTQRISILTWLSQLSIRLLISRRGELVGTDRFGNRYFREKKARPGMKVRRWVLFAGEPEASAIPAEWHGWLHYSMEQPLPENSAYHKPWVKPHEANQTGTVDAYRPPGHTYEGGHRAAATGDYEPWTPA